MDCLNEMVDKHVRSGEFVHEIQITWF